MGANHTRRSGLSPQRAEHPGGVVRRRLVAFALAVAVVACAGGDGSGGRGRASGGTVALGDCDAVPAAAGEPGAALATLTVDYPLAGSIFPPDFMPPTFLWHDADAGAERWQVQVAFDDGKACLTMEVDGPPPPAGEIDPLALASTNEVYEPTPYQASARSWTPDPTVWEAIKAGARDGKAVVQFFGLTGAGAGLSISEFFGPLIRCCPSVGRPLASMIRPIQLSSGANWNAP